MKSGHMHILVIGRTGQLATSLAEAGGRAGVEGLRVTTAGRREADLRCTDALARLFGETRPDVVVNAAAYTAVDKAETDAACAFAINAEGAENVAREATAFDCPIIHVSTDYVFDGTRDGAYAETDATAPASVYGRSKREGEERVAAACARHVILRTAWVHSPFGANFVKTMLRLAGEREILRVVDDQSGSPTYAPHLAEAIVELAGALAREEAGGRWGIYHAAGGGETTWCGLARETFARSRDLGGAFTRVEAIPTSAYPTAAARPANSRLDCSRLSRDFGIALPDWRDGVAACVARLVQNPAAASYECRQRDASNEVTA